MKVVLTNCPRGPDASLYTIADRFERFDAYISLFSSGTSRGGGRRLEVNRLPLGTFSPMGERQGVYLDQLTAITLGAENLAQTTADDVATDFAKHYLNAFRLMLVVADVPRNGWTQRQLTDADWRFTLQERHALPKSA